MRRKKRSQSFLVPWCSAVESVDARVCRAQSFPEPGVQWAWCLPMAASPPGSKAPVFCTAAASHLFPAVDGLTFFTQPRPLPTGPPPPVTHSLLALAQTCPRSGCGPCLWGRRAAGNSVAPGRLPLASKTNLTFAVHCTSTPVLPLPVPVSPSLTLTLTPPLTRQLLAFPSLSLSSCHPAPTLRSASFFSSALAADARRPTNNSKSRVPDGRS